MTDNNKVFHFTAAVDRFDLVFDQFETRGPMTMSRQKQT